MEKVQLKRGDWLRIDGLNEELLRKIADEFVLAGAEDRGDLSPKRPDGYSYATMGWDERDGEVWSVSFKSSGFIGRDLTVDQVLGREKPAEPEPEPEAKSSPEPIDCSRPQDCTVGGNEVVNIWGPTKNGMYAIVWKIKDGSDEFETAFAYPEGLEKRPNFEPMSDMFYQFSDTEDFSDARARVREFLWMVKENLSVSNGGKFVDAGYNRWKYIRQIPAELRYKFVFEGD